MTQIVKTTVIITSTDSEYSLPGDVSVADIIASYSSQIPGLSSMQNSSQVQNIEGIGSVRVITFSPRTGTKG